MYTCVCRFMDRFRLSKLSMSSKVLSNSKREREGNFRVLVSCKSQIFTLKFPPSEKYKVL